MHLAWHELTSRLLQVSKENNGEDWQLPLVPMRGPVEGYKCVTHKTSVIISSSATAISILTGSTALGSCSVG